MPPTVTSTSTPLPKRFLILPVIAVVALAGGAGLWWFVLRGEAPPPADLSDAVAGIGDGATTTEPLDDPTGVWVVDPELRSAAGTGTFAGFRVNEELSSIGFNTAVGRTGDVTGRVAIAGTTVTDAEITVDLTTIRSDDQRRDRRIQEALETGRFPEASFVLTEPIRLGATPAAGESRSVVAIGELTVHGVTRPAAFDLQAQVVGDVLVLVGTHDVVFADHGVQAPSAPMVLSVDDHGVIELQLFLRLT